VPKVFISHCTLDRDFVEREIVSLLERHGIDVWYSPDSIVSADQWERSILDGLKTSDWFLLVMSPRSAVSSWVRMEVAWAFNKGRRIVPVLLEDC
jgi:hypothetical protein